MKIRLFIKKLLLFSLPFAALILFYLYQDPFKVIYHYGTYYQSGRPSYVTLNRGYVSTQNWINHYPQFKYDSYIFGNSRSLFYQAGSWSTHLHCNSRSCYHFDASNESLKGMQEKFSLLSGGHAPIRNALIIFDAELLSGLNDLPGHLFCSCPALSGENPFSFQIKFLGAFLNAGFLAAYTDLKSSGRLGSYIQKFSKLDDRPVTYDSVTNELRLDYFENMIVQDSGSYYRPRRQLFYQRDSVQRYSPKVIGEGQMWLLTSIRDILKANHTNYKIVISPLYDQMGLNRSDLECLRQLFGKENVFDFSGINSITANFHNYYEASHYRPGIASSIMDSVYRK